MTAKIATAKTTTASTASPAKKAPSVRKAVSKKVPVAAAAKPAKVTQEKQAKKIKQPGNKIKVVRDNFSMPQSDYAKIGELKQLCLKDGLQVKKNQLLRAGLHALVKMSETQLKTALSSLDKASVKLADPAK